jgi:hypothetical protein
MRTYKIIRFYEKDGFPTPAERTIKKRANTCGGPGTLSAR